PPHSFFFFITSPRRTLVSTLSLHDALPISALFAALRRWRAGAGALHHRPDLRGGGGGAHDLRHARAAGVPARVHERRGRHRRPRDRKSTRLNSSHRTISYAVFCLKKTKGAE